LERRTPQGHYVRPFEDWGKLIGDVPSATAILDRFLHHAEIIQITGKSYRLRNQASAAKTNAATPPDTADADDSKPAKAPPGPTAEPPASRKKAAKPTTEPDNSCQS